MPSIVDVHVFRDHHFAPNDGNTVVCIAKLSAVKRFLTVEEIDWAFSGYALYRSWPWTTYIGVWGTKNASRFRRFLRERGAEVAIHRAAPPKFRLVCWKTYRERRRVRDLSACGRDAPISGIRRA